MEDFRGAGRFSLGLERHGWKWWLWCSGVCSEGVLEVCMSQYSLENVVFCEPAVGVGAELGIISHVVSSILPCQPFL